MTVLAQGWVWIVLAAALNASALALLRTAGLQMTWQHSILAVPLNGLLALLAGILLYAVALLVTLRILTLHQFIVAVPLFVGVQFVFTALLAYGLFHETLSLQGWLGIAIILFGISLLATGAK